MRQNNCELRVLVKGKPITEYPHEGLHYVEGRANSEFEIEFQNQTGGRVMAVLSVDGLSVMDGKPAGPGSSGYLVNVGDTLRVPGWKLDAQQVAKFVFAGKGGSYVEQSGGDDRNRGVLGVLVYGEKTPHVGHYWMPGFSGGVMPMASGGLSGGMNINSIKSAARGIECSAGGSFTASNAVASTTTGTAEAQNLGTGFGGATQFNTTLVSFTRGDLITMMVLYYDDRKGLQQRGIRIARPSRRKYATTPQAFPQMGCAPPPGWQR